MDNFTPLHTPHRVQRFSFSSFGEEEKKPEAAAQMSAVKEELPTVEIAPPEKMITEAELSAARQESREQGYKEGFAAAEGKFKKEDAAREEEIKSTLAVIANRITIAAEEHAAFMAGRQEIMNNAVLAIARKVAGEALKLAPYSGIEELIGECTGLISGEASVTVTVSPKLAAGLKQRIDGLRPLLPGFEGELVVEEDTAMGDNDCRVAWKNGYAQHDTAKLWNDIEAIITRSSLLKKNNE